MEGHVPERRIVRERTVLLGDCQCTKTTGSLNDRRSEYPQRKGDVN